MDPLGVACLVLGALVIAVRGPLAVAPSATLRVYRRLLASDRSLRSVAVAIGLLGIVLAVSVDASAGVGEGVLEVVSWLLALAALWLLARPASYRRLADTLLAAIEDSAVLRIFGLVGIGFGGALIWLGLRIG